MRSCLLVFTLLVVVTTAALATGGRESAVPADPALPVLAVSWTEIRGDLAPAQLRATMFETLRAVQGSRGCLHAELFAQPGDRHFKLLTWWVNLDAVLDFQHGESHARLERWLGTLPPGAVEHAVGLYQRVPGGLRVGFVAGRGVRDRGATRPATTDRPVLGIIAVSEPGSASPRALEPIALRLESSLAKRPEVDRVELHRGLARRGFYLVAAQWHDAAAATRLAELAEFQTLRDHVTQNDRTRGLHVDFYQLVGGHPGLPSR